MEKAEVKISTVADKTGLESDEVLSELRPGLMALGYAVENGKTAANTIRRPVLFGENGKAAVNYEIDAFHDDLGVAGEVEADAESRGTYGWPRVHALQAELAATDTPAVAAGGASI